MDRKEQLKELIGNAICDGYMGGQTYEESLGSGEYISMGKIVSRYFKELDKILEEE